MDRLGHLDFHSWDFSGWLEKLPSISRKALESLGERDSNSDPSFHGFSTTNFNNEYLNKTTFYKPGHCPMNCFSITPYKFRNCSCRPKNRIRDLFKDHFIRKFLHASPGQFSNSSRTRSRSQNTLRSL